MPLDPRFVEARQIALQRGGGIRRGAFTFPPTFAGGDVPFQTELRTAAAYRAEGARPRYNVSASTIRQGLHSGSTMAELQRVGLISWEGSTIHRSATTPWIRAEEAQERVMRMSAPGRVRTMGAGGRVTPLQMIADPMPQSVVTAAPVMSATAQQVTRQARVHTAATNPTLRARAGIWARRQDWGMLRPSNLGGTTARVGVGVFRGLPGTILGAGVGAVVGGPFGATAGAMLGGTVGTSRLARMIPWGGMARGAGTVASGAAAGGFEAATWGVKSAARLALQGGSLPGRMLLGAAAGGMVAGLPGVGVGLAFGMNPAMKFGLGGVARKAAGFAINRPGIAGALMGVALMGPALLRGARAAVAPSDEELPQVGFGTFDQQYGLDPNNLNTQGLTLALHNRRFSRG